LFNLKQKTPMLASDKFKALFQKNYANLCSVAYRYVNDPDICEDIVQDTFVRFWKLGKYELAEKDAFFYLTTSVKNNSISYLRKSCFSTVSINDENMDYCFPDDGNINFAEEQPASQEASHIIERALSLLPPKCSLIFRMSRFDKKEYREIATELQISVKTVENHMGKALRILRDFVANNPDLNYLVVSVLLMGQMN